ncbi:universal stress protein [Pseudomonas sp. DWP3-1-2]|uniref:universal stress protein n=1 Tax=Pseudomonas sp. DWP3-1-2 TaxID=2804645 RepID=UPI003CF45E25
MPQIQRILLIASSQMNRTPAFECAVAMAAKNRAVLHIVTFDYLAAVEIVGLFSQKSMAKLCEAYLQTHQQWLEQEAEHERHKGLHVQTRLVWTGHVVAEINHYANVINADLIIKDIHHEPTIKRVFATPLDWRILRDCRVPVYLVSSAGKPMPEKILALVNLYRTRDEDLQLNDSIMHMASRLAAQCQARLQVLYVYDWTRIYASKLTMLGLMPIETGFVEALGDAHQEAFTFLNDRYGIALNDRHFLSGDPACVIGDFAADNDIDVLVMGTLQRRKLSAVLGDTAEKLLGHAPCSVLMIDSAVRHIKSRPAMTDDADCNPLPDHAAHPD